MAISQEVPPSPAVAPNPEITALSHSNIARLEHFVGRRSPEHRHRAGHAPFDPQRLHQEFNQLTIRFEPDQRALWCLVNHPERPCFTPRLLDQIRTLQARLRHGLAHAPLSDMPVRTIIWGSTFPGIWNLGGDLALFTRLIRARAAGELRSYAYACIDAVYQNLILSGRLYEAPELEELGLVDLVVDQGEGPAAVREYLERNRRRHDTLLALSRVRQRCQPITYEELIDVTEVWVETALGLHEADLRRMEHLVRAQLRRH